MKITNIKINNLSSFVNFSNGVEFKKTNLIFGVNGSGKSTLTSLFQYIDRYKNEPNNESQEELVNFLNDRFSKEANESIAEISIDFTQGYEHFTFDKDHNQLSFQTGNWYPIKVFNENYTNRNISNNIELDISDNGLIIGEPNKELESSLKKLDNLQIELVETNERIEATISQAISKYRELTSSEAKSIEVIISKDNLLKDNCDYEDNPEVIDRRKALGFGKPDKTISQIEPELMKFNVNIDEIEQVCMDKEFLAEIDESTTSLLLKYTDFYKEGLVAYEKENMKRCPFCFREWPEADKTLNKFHDFIYSSYNQKRDKLKKFLTDLEEYKKRILSNKSHIDALYQIVKC